MKIRHYYFFGDEIQGKLTEGVLNEDGWDLLRRHGDNAFSIENDIRKYEKNCMQAVEYQESAFQICDILKKNNTNKVVSLGCGKGILEWHIKKQMPQIHMTCTDYASEGIEQLKRIFPTCDEILRSDMMGVDYSIWKGATLLMYRISTEFSKQEWQSIFYKMHEGGVERIIFVPTEVLTLRIAFNEMKRHFINRLRRRKDTMCGWMYSKKEFIDMYGKSYSIENEVKMKNTVIWSLRIKENQ